MAVEQTGSEPVTQFTQHETTAAGSSTKTTVGLIMPGPRAGGVRQSAQAMLDDLKSAGFAVCVFAQEPEDGANLPAGVKVLPGPRLKAGAARIARYVRLAWGGTDRESLRFEAVVQKAGVQVLIYPTPVACPPPRHVPFIVVIPDLMHRYYPALPEYRWPRTLARDIVYGRYARDAAMVIVDAAQGARDVEKFLGVARAKCRVVPFRPPPSIYAYREITQLEARWVLERFALPESFIFYPAQLWTHKNHDRLIEALAILKRAHGLEIPLVCAGWTDGTFATQAARVRQNSERLDVRAQLHFTGYVTSHEMAALYRLARALVFPSLFGPTNIPPLEAMVMGTPVLCSSLFGMPEQVGDAGILFDPFKPEDIADAIKRIWTDAGLCAHLAAQGRRRIVALEAMDFAQCWREMIRAAGDPATKATGGLSDDVAPLY